MTILYQILFWNNLKITDLLINTIWLVYIKLFDFKFRLLSLYIREVDIFYILSFSFNEKQGIRNRKKGGRGRKDWKQSKSSSDLSQNYRVLKKAVHGYLIPRNCKNMQEIDFPQWLFWGQTKTGQTIFWQMGLIGCPFLLLFKSHWDISISCIFLKSPNQVNMKIVVECWKDFLYTMQYWAAK